MGLFDRAKRSENQVNELPPVQGWHTTGWFTPLDGMPNRIYSDMYKWLIIKTIFDGLRNVRYYTTEERDEEVESVADIIAFIDTNMQTLIWQWWNLGFICVGKRTELYKGKRVTRYYIPKKNDIRTDKDKRVTNFDIVYYSDTYLYERRSTMQIIDESLKAIDVYKNGDIHITENYGALGIFTGKGLPVNPKEKDEFEADLNQNYGIQKEKKQILLSTMPLEFKQFTLPVKQLELPEKIAEEMKTLCRFFNLPVDMVFGGSTFNNQKQATVNFYRNCIAPLAEVVLQVGRYMMKSDIRLLIPSEHLTFKFDNVAELEDDRTAEIEYKIKLVELVERMRALNLDTAEYDEQLKQVIS